MTNNYSEDNFGSRKLALAEVRPFDTSGHDARRISVTSARDSAGQASADGLLTNKILSSLPDEDFTRLFPHLEPVSLPFGDNLYRMGDDIRFAYFPENTVVSLLHILEDGSVAEATMIGKEGIIGLAAIFGSRPSAHWTQVTVSGAALRIDIEALQREFARGGALQQLILAYAGRCLTQLAQRAVCNSRHMLRERLCSWLLMIHDRMGIDQLPLTQEQIARHLGTRRAGISEAAKTLRDEQTILYSRGHIRILNRELLEAAACECFRAADEPTARRQVFA